MKKMTTRKTQNAIKLTRSFSLRLGFRGLVSSGIFHFTCHQEWVQADPAALEQAATLPGQNEGDYADGNDLP
jgi:hypothetical protein